tara:strand:+ start:6872 stop:7114 length:243 start_codon:yes stop_codon:yes gene_type:complete
MKKIILIALFLVLIFANYTLAGPPKSKFYDFGDQLIDGSINKPTALYTDAKKQVKFDRLLRLKKSFLKALYVTAKEKVFK